MTDLLPACVLCVCACVCVYVCVHSVCLLSPYRHFLTEKNKCKARDQASDVAPRKCFFVKNLFRHVIDNHNRELYASNCGRVSIKPGRTTRSKRQLLKNSLKLTVKARSIVTFLLTKLESRSASAQGQILAMCTTPRGVL